MEIDYDALYEAVESDLNGSLTFKGPNRQASLHVWAAIAGAAELLTGLVFLPIHRIILGTSPTTIVGYVLTCGGCGVITLIDTVLLIVYSRDERYVGSSRFIMW